MYMRYTPTDVTSSYAALTALNANFDGISTLFEKCLMTDGTAPNAMQANIDLNHNQINNVANATSNTDAVNYGQVLSIFNGNGTGSTGNNQMFSQNNAVIYRLGDRIAVGGATVSDFAFPNVTKDWLSSFQVAAGLSSGSALSANIVSLTNTSPTSAVGVLGGSRSTNFTSAGTNAIGGEFIAVNNHATLATHAWGIYSEAHKITAATGSIYGAEFDVRSLVTTIKPNPNQQGDVVALQLASGAQLGSSSDVSAAIQIADNGAKFKTGINFISTALVVTSGQSDAIVLAPGMKVSWVDGSSVEQSYLDGNVFKNKVYTVATLPAAGVMGRRSFVSDANATTFASVVAGGGTNKVPVYDNGTNWCIG